MPIVQLTHVQNYLGQVMTNRYFYRTSLTINVPVLEELMDEFNAEIVPLVKRLQHTSVQHISIDTFEVEGIIFATLGISGTGLNTGQEAASWNALSFKLQRTNGSTKSGGKRIGGLSEANIAGNVVDPDPNYLGWIDDYAQAVDNVLSTTSGTWSPVLVRFDPNNPGTVLADQLIAGCSFSRLSTQNTRKPE